MKQNAAQIRLGTHGEDYGSWMSNPVFTMVGALLALAVVLAALSFLVFHLAWLGVIFAVAAVVFLALLVWITWIRKQYAFGGGGMMERVHQVVLSHLDFVGEGTLLEVGCGSGALAILCAKTWPSAQVTGIDYWGKEWNYAKAQCEENARIEQVPAVQFCQGDAAHLPFADGSFDAAVSNFVFHEVRTQPDKRQVVREALRVIKKGGSFAFHDLFEQKQLYGDMDEFLEFLRREGIREIHYEAHTERLPMVPWFAKAPWMLTGLGLIYGRK